mmetsp:Transcript_8055/g.17925  ORF Transcript_8055/g.17925 Transcript_8055/m.17925 type:complete len:127 (-) Transcript_8055:38-418(-)
MDIRNIRRSFEGVTPADHAYLRRNQVFHLLVKVVFTCCCILAVTRIILLGYCCSIFSATAILPVKPQGHRELSLTALFGLVVVTEKLGLVVEDCLLVFIAMAYSFDIYIIFLDVDAVVLLLVGLSF